MARGINNLIWCYYYVPYRAFLQRDTVYKLCFNSAGLTSKEYKGNCLTLEHQALSFFLGVASNLSTSGFNSVDIFVNNLNVENLRIYDGIIESLKSSFGAKVWSGGYHRYVGENLKKVWVPVGFRVVVPGGVIHIWDQSQISKIPTFFHQCFDHGNSFIQGIPTLDPEDTLIIFNDARALKGGADWTPV